MWVFYFIYDHHWFVSNRLKIGIGLLISYNNGSWRDPQPLNLLPTLKWTPSNRLNVNISWDNIQIRRFITKEIIGVLETRYDLSFFKLYKPYSVYFETISIGGGFDINLFKHYYLKLRFKEVVYNNSYIKYESTNAKHSLSDIDERSISLTIVSAK